MEKVSIIAQLKQKKPTDQEATIIIRGFYNRKPVASKSTGHRVRVDHWDSYTRQVRAQAPNAALINTIIQKRLQEMKALLMRSEIAGHRVNRAQVQKAVQGIDDSKDYLAFCRERIRVEYTNKETVRSYLAECTKLEQFRPAVSFSDIDYAFLTAYRRHMLELGEGGNDENTVWKSFKFMNTMLRKAIKMGGIITENPFAEFDRGRYRQKRRNYLELADCDKIEKIAQDENQPVLIRRISIRFLFMCYGGMRFSDAMAFDPAVHVQNDERIVMNYQKFNTTVNNLMWDRLKNMVHLLKDAPLKISNQKFNQWLKMIAALAGIEKNLTSHMGRHTLGALLAEMEVPRDTARVILGHRDIRSTDIYYHQKAKVQDKALLRLNEKSPL